MHHTRSELTIDEIMAEQDPAKQRQAFAVLERFLRAEFRRYNLSERQWVVADLILQLTYGAGRKAVRIPKLEFFKDLTGITVGNVHSALEQLHNRRIVITTEKGDVKEYTISPDPDRWQVAPRQTRAKIREAIEWIEMFNGGKIARRDGGHEHRVANGPRTGKGCQRKF